MLPPAWLWLHINGLAVLVIGFIVLRKELLAARPMEKLVLLGPLFLAAPLAVFGTEHFTNIQSIAGIVPSWIPGHLFWAVLVGTCLIAAALSLATRIQSGLAALLFAIMMFSFEALIHIPGAIQDPHNRFSWVIVFRETSFGAGALAIAAGQSRWSERAKHAALTFARLWLGAALIFYGVQQILHPAFVPGVPLRQLTPLWIPGHMLWGYLTGIVYVPAGLCLLANWRARSAAISAGAMILLLLAAVYLPIVIAKPSDIANGVNYLFDTMLLGGSILGFAGGYQEAAINRPVASATVA